jgi:O-antigen ligase
LNTVALHQFLVLYMWFPLAALLLLMLLIGRFYQKFSGEQTYFWLYIVVMFLFGAAAVRYAGAGIVVADALTDGLMFVAGSLLLFLSGVLYRRMMNQSPQ